MENKRNFWNYQGNGKRIYSNISFFYPANRG